MIRSAPSLEELTGTGGRALRRDCDVDRAQVSDKAQRLRDAAERELAGERALMVGDRHSAADAGPAAGMSTIWAGWGYGIEPEREQARPDYSVPHFVR